MNKFITRCSGNFKKAIATLFPITLFTILFTNSITAQNPSCGSEKYLQEQLATDPGLKARMDAIKLNAQQGVTFQAAARIASSAITIPVVIHVVYNTSAQNISDAQIQSEIDVLNEDYSRLNADTINTPGVFKPLAANAGVQFVLAKQDPNGNATNGITRTSTAVISFSTNNYVKFSSYGGQDAWNTTQYLNIWVCNLPGYGGYSSMPGETASIDGVVINYLCFGRVGTLMSTRNKGRASTHEIGHWLGLAHLWGWSGTCGDDAIADTPMQEKANSGVPVFPHLSSCSPNSNGDMFMDYMDYSDDVALNMFTIDQAAEMNATLNGYRASILTSLGGTAPGTATVCNMPGGLSATSITTSGATLNWSTTDAVSYNVRYKTTASTIWTTTSAATNSLTLTGVSSGTNYEFQVAGVCSGSSTSAFSSSVTFATSFTTSAAPTTFVIVGSSNATMSESPYGTSYVKEHTQFIVTQSELVAAGYNAINNIINSLSFFVNTASAKTLSGFTIKISHTSVSGFVSSNFLSTSSAATVYSSGFLTSATGWNKHSFTSPFIYNGTDNLLIDVSWSNTSASTSSIVNCTASTSSKTLYCGATNKKTNLNNISSGTLTLNRPNMLFEFIAPMPKISSSNPEPAISKSNREVELYPNPVTSVLNIALSGISETTQVKISIFNIAGGLVTSYDRLSENSNKQIIPLDFSSNNQLQDLHGGIYFCVIDCKGGRVTKKFILARN